MQLSRINRLLIAIGLFLALGAKGAHAAGNAPKLEVVERAVAAELAALNLSPTELITRTDATRLLAAAEKVGWRLPKERQEELLKLCLEEKDYLVKKLRTSAGRKLQGKISTMPMAYDRLDRLSQMPQGKNTVEAIIRGPDGDKLLEYMTETKGGKNLGKMLSHTSTGKDFNKPTGRIYNAQSLVRYLVQAKPAP